MQYNIYSHLAKASKKHQTRYQDSARQMSKAKEIQEKLTLQAKLQAAFSETSSKAAKWLENDAAVENDENLISSKKSFYQLPVIGMGAGLSFDDQVEDGGSEDISTIGEFIKSDKKVSSLAKKKKGRNTHENNNSSKGIHKINSDDTRAMIALKRKMRSSNIQNSRRLQAQSPSTNAPTDKKGYSQAVASTADESDDDDEPRVAKTSKKSFGLLFESKKPRKR